MNNFNILWIDDVWEKNIDSNDFIFLNAIKNKLEKEGNDTIKIIISPSISHAVTTINSDNIDFDFVIVDLIYKNETNFNYFEIIKAINKKKVKFAIFSEYEKDYQNTPVFNLGKDFLFGLYNKQNYEDLIKDLLEISSFSSINFIQLSDFHFDSTLKGNDYKNQEIRFDKLIDFLKAKNLNDPIDFMIFSGDFANKEIKNDLKECAKYIRKLVNSSMSGLFERFFIVPGNHDIEWSNFEESEISSKPCESFYEFYKEVYDNDLDIISNLIGYNSQTKLFDSSFSPDCFCFSRIVNKRISILGLNSVMVEKDYKGKGMISQSTINFLNHEWDKKATQNEFRIATFHHNLLPPFSLNPKEENGNLLNSGYVIEELTKFGCDLVLSGHCHDTYYYNFSYNILGHEGFSSIKNLSYISSGTSGGYSPTYDRARSFNIIKIFATREKHTKELHITPIIYDSRTNEWIELKTLITNIKQNR